MNAYSRLKRLLKQQSLSVPELQRLMQSRGLHVNVKSLYRLSDDSQPVNRLDMRFAGGICQACAVPLTEWIVFEEETAELHTLAPEKQALLEALMTKNNAGSLTAQERDELRVLVHEVKEIALTNAGLLAHRHRFSSLSDEALSAS